MSTGTSTRFCDPQAKYCMEHKTEHEEKNDDKDKYLLLTVQSGNSQGIKDMPLH